ncbi:response regulator [Cyclobacterium jeungdonense]|uniref:Response regulator n=1 Tax=Cyclobacterium jeungdonense TaxID=708087 RepID=A0ABT8C6M4_9BACT|nr:response regulator [Cyclobacterium jeungdonense]MDN3687674.1 response regulator [Cyclobacterium jeungdonense]
MENKIFDLGGKRLLIVDDDPVIRLIMKATFKAWQNTGFDMAVNGAAALEQLKTPGYDLILMDLQMPVLDGYETTHAIRSGHCGSEYQKIPIIAITADLSEIARAKCLRVGIDEFLSKPVDGSTLYATIQYLFHIRRSKAG